MISKRTFLSTTMLAIMLMVSSPAFAVELTVGSDSGDIDQTLQVPIAVSDPTGIAGAAFTLEYNTDALTVDIESTFFDTFASQFAGTQAPTSVEVDGQTYIQPLVTNDVSGTGTRIAAARAVAADGSSSTLFKLNVSLIQGANAGSYLVSIVQTELNNTAAGYSADGEPIPFLVGALADEANLALAFPEIQVTARTPGIVTFDGTDRDGDGLPDSVETNTGTFVDSTDTGTDPDNPDTDNDGYSDGVEVDNQNLDPFTDDPPGGTDYDPSTDMRTYGISGTISYDGGETGTLYVAVFDDSDFGTANELAVESFDTPAFPQDYDFTGLEANATYYVAAYLDVGNDNLGEPGTEDPLDEREVPISADMSGSDLILEKGTYQIVYGSSETVSVPAEGDFDLDINYSTSDEDNTLTGLGLRIHYDSSKLIWNSFSDILSTDKIAEDSTPQDDTENYDGDASTDKYLSIAWTNIGGNWPSIDLPTKLLTANFSVNSGIEWDSEDDSTHVRFTASSVASGYSFEGEPVRISPQSFTLDIDGNGKADALTDGLLILRYLFGFGGSTLIADVIAPDATRTTAAEIEDVVAAGVDSSALDVDCNGKADALTDGLLILRYLFGFGGSTLIADVVAPDAECTTAAEIEEYLEGLKP